MKIKNVGKIDPKKHLEDKYEEVFAECANDIFG